MARTGMIAVKRGGCRFRGGEVEVGDGGVRRQKRAAQNVMPHL